jgi:hypothetical protein
MNKLVIICLLTILGCKDKSSNVNVDTKKIEYTVDKYHTFEIVIVDNCEYLFGTYDSGGIVLSHKGNCKNPHHRDNNLK